MAVSAARDGLLDRMRGGGSQQRSTGGRWSGSGWMAQGAAAVPHGALRLESSRAELLLERGAQLPQRLDLGVGARGRVQLVDQILPLGHQRSRERPQRRVLLEGVWGAGG